MEYQDARASMYANLGGVQLHQQLMWTIDMRPIKYELHMEIIEIDERYQARCSGDGVTMPEYLYACKNNNHPTGDQGASDAG